MLNWASECLSGLGMSKIFKLASLLAAFLVFALFPRALRAQSSVAGPQDSQQLDNEKPVPIFTGSAGFISDVTGGSPDIHPIFSGIILIPIGDRWLIESRGTFESDMVQLPGRSGFHGEVEKELEYVQVDFIANPYLTITAGRFLTPFGIYNERLYPVWIRDLPSDPLILPIGVGPSNASTGAMLRGGFAVTLRRNYKLRGLFFRTLHRHSRRFRTYCRRTSRPFLPQSPPGNWRVISASFARRALQSLRHSRNLATAVIAS